jgi:hypothetical protein
MPHDIGPESRPHVFDFVEKTPIRYFGSFTYIKHTSPSGKKNKVTNVRIATTRTHTPFSSVGIF